MADKPRDCHVQCGKTFFCICQIIIGCFQSGKSFGLLEFKYSTIIIWLSIRFEDFFFAVLFGVDVVRVQKLSALRVRLILCINFCVSFANMLRNLSSILSWRIEQSWVILSTADGFARLSPPGTYLDANALFYS